MSLKVQFDRPLDDRHFEVREHELASDFPGFALRNVLRKTGDPAAMTPVMQTFTSAG